MGIPKNINIGAHQYQVVLTDAIDDFGSCENIKGRILINKTAPKSFQEETLIHESIHAIFDQTGISRGLNDEEEEKLVQPLGHAIYQLIKDNPEVFTNL